MKLGSLIHDSSRPHVAGLVTGFVGARAQVKVGAKIYLVKPEHAKRGRKHRQPTTVLGRQVFALARSHKLRIAEVENFLRSS